MFNYLKQISYYSANEMIRIFRNDDVFSKTYTEYYHDILRYAYKLEKILGSAADKHVGIIASSSYEYLVILAATIFCRAVAIPINNRESPQNLLRTIADADLDLLLYDFLPSNSGINETIIVSAINSFVEKIEPYEKTLLDFSDKEKDHVAMIVYTSGTTSLSKGVVLTAANLFGREISYLPASCFSEERSGKILTYISGPFYHVSGILPWVSWTEHGYTVCLSADPRNILVDFEKNKVDVAGVTPSIIKLWLKAIKHNNLKRLGGVSYILSAGAPLDPEWINIYISVGIKIIQIYGMTETGDIAINYDMEKHAKSVGKAAEGVDISIIDNEICVKSAGNMLGYYKSPDETEKVLKNGIIYTGDLGYLDEEGYLYITGRKKNLIILSGGENVSPEEIEAKLYENPLIKECKVFEKNDRIVVEIFAPESEEEMIRKYIDQINSSFPIYKRIYRIYFRDQEFEKTAIGKIKR